MTGAHAEADVSRGAEPERQLAVTLFADTGAQSVKTREFAWSQLVEHIRSPRQYERKANMPLVKLARFGGVRTDKGSLRHDANVLAIDGIEGDYDAGELSIADAATLLADTGIVAMLYTSPNHGLVRPRWRVLCPLARERTPDGRRMLVGRLNRVLGGVLAAESFVLSQSYFVGRARLRDDGTPAVYEAQEVRGHRCIDEADELEPLYPVNGQARESAASEARDDPVLNILRERGVLLRTIKPGTHALRCPWEAQHTKDTGDSATAYLQANFDGRRVAGFKCQHAHCAGRTLRDLLNHLDVDADEKGAARAHASALAPDVAEAQTEAQSATAGDLRAPTWPSPIDAAAMHGIAGEFVRMIEPNTESDPVAILVQFLAAFGALVGRGPHWRVERDEHHANLYALLVGESAKARKGTSWGRVRQVFSLTGWKAPVGGLSTGEGLKYHVRDAREERKAKQSGEVITEIVDEGVADKRLLVYQSEFACVLRVASRDGNTLSGTLREGYDSGNLGTLTKNDPITATGAHICIVGHITADELRGELTATDTANGFANRFLFVGVKRSKILPFGGDADDIAEVAAFADRLRQRANEARARSRIEMTADARVVWEKVYPELSAGSAGLHGAVTARAEAHVVRLALIYCLLDGAERIDVPHLLAALAIWQYCDATAKFIFGASLGDRIADEIMRRLRQAGEVGMTRTDISNAFKRNVPADRIGAALELLARRARAVCTSEPAGEKGGRTAEVWKATK